MHERPAAHRALAAGMLAIVSATPEENATLVASLTGVTTREFGRRHYHVGSYRSVEVVVVFSRMGKVAAAATTAQLLASFPVSALVFSGVAGAVRTGLAIGDVVVGTQLLQHDMDATPLFPRYEVPLCGTDRFVTDAPLRARLRQAAEEFLRHDLHSAVAAAELAAFKIRAPQVSEGMIVSGDKFFASSAELDELRQRLPLALCVEMEGAAVAQVCDEYALPFGIVRVISDAADESAVHDFPRFSREIARHYSTGILARFAQRL